MNTITLFSGGGGFDIGAIQAGANLVGGVEKEKRIGETNKRNISGEHLAIDDIRNVPPETFPKSIYIHNSQPCTSYSPANSTGEEDETDIELAKSYIEYIKYHDPLVTTIENVYQFRTGDAWKYVIAPGLHNLGYSFTYDNLNMADYGVPQTRERMIVVARKGNIKPTLPPHTHQHSSKLTGQMSLFGSPLPAWLGWYQAVEHLIPFLPNSHFAPWQKKRLAASGLLETVLVGGSNKSQSFLDYAIINGQSIPNVNTVEKPSMTITANLSTSDYRAVLVEGRVAGERPLQVIEGDEPAYTMVTSSGGNVIRAVLSSNKGFMISASDVKNGVTRFSYEPSSTIRATRTEPNKAWLIDAGNTKSNGSRKYRFGNEPSKTVSANEGKPTGFSGSRIVQMTPEALGALQTFPPGYQFERAKRISKTKLKRYLHPDQITDENIEFLCQFPAIERYLWTLDGEAVKIIGNAVPCHFAYLLTKHVMGMIQ